MNKKSIPPAETPIQETARLLCGAVCLGAGVLSAICAAVLMVQGGFSPTYLVGLVPGIGIGIQLLSDSPVARVRQRLLAERDAAPPDQKALYVEKPPRPDEVYVAVLTGILSIFTIPVVFAPVAVVSGVLALRKGHGVGLAGVIMGLVGFVLWAVLFHHLFLSNPRL